MKLTNDIRKQIIDKAVASTDIPKRREKLKKDIKALALTVVKAQTKVPECLVAIWANPETRAQCAGFLYTTSKVSIQADGFSYRHCDLHKQHTNYDPHNLPVEVVLDDPILAPHGSKYAYLRTSNTEVAVDPSHVKAAAELVKFHRDTNAQEESVRTNLHSIVYAANTKAQLMKVWPEGEAFIPAEKVKPTMALLPAETILEVNRKLGLSK